MRACCGSAWTIVITGCFTKWTRRTGKQEGRGGQESVALRHHVCAIFSDAISVIERRREIFSQFLFYVQGAPQNWRADISLVGEDLLSSQIGKSIESTDHYLNVKTVYNHESKRYCTDACSSSAASTFQFDDWKVAAEGSLLGCDS